MLALDTEAQVVWPKQKQMYADSWCMISALWTRSHQSVCLLLSTTKLCSWLIDCEDKWKNEWAIKCTLTSTRTVACPHVNQCPCCGKCISTISCEQECDFSVIMCDIAVIQFSKHHWVTYIFRHNIVLYFVYFSFTNGNISRWGENTINTQSLNELLEWVSDSMTLS